MATTGRLNPTLTGPAGRYSMACLVGVLAAQAGAVSIAPVLGAKKSFVIARTETPPSIDGVLDDDAWLTAAVVDDFHQTVPRNGNVPTEATIVRILYDDDYLYIGADLQDSKPQAIVASQLIQGRDFSSDDRFWVSVDSFNSKRNDYFFQVNANGIRREALRENNTRFIEEWAAIWYAQSALHGNGWATEIAIPFQSISFDPASDTWGINFGRGIVRKQEFNVWSSYERQDWPVYAGEVSGIADIRQGVGLDVTPSVNFGRQRDFSSGGTSQDSIEPSLDAVYKIIPSLSAVLTLNTDFSTAEVDDQQIALDRFSLFFPEKRDFFLQDAGIFEFGNIDNNGRPFFSRRIGLSADGNVVGLDGGVKLTGRIGNYNVGALAMRQEAYEDIEASDLIVLRGSANILDESALGFIATHGDPTSNESNTLIGADFLYRDSDGIFGQIVEAQAWLQQTTTGGASDEGQAYGVRIEMPNDRINAYLGALEIQENFNPALGFVNRTGIRRFEGGVRYRTRPEQGRLRTVNHRLDLSLVTDPDGTLMSRLMRLRPVTINTHADDFLYIEWKDRRENVIDDFELFDRLNVPAGNYSFNRYRAELLTGLQRPVSVVLAVEGGGFFDGDRLEKTVELQWRQSRHLSMDIRYTENDVDLPDGSFVSRLASLRTDIAFNAKWSWSNTLQFDNSDERLALNSRLRYMPEAGREALLVLNHGVVRNEENRFDSELNALNLKLSYTFRY